MVEDANKLSGAVGQAARESKTWTNQTGNLKQAWTDFKAMIGSNFLEGAVGGIEKAVGAVQRLTEFVSNCFEVWREVVQPGVDAVGRALESLGIAFKPILQGFYDMLPASVQADGAMGLVRDVAYWLEEALYKVSVKIQTFAGYVMKYMPAVQSAFSKMWEMCKHVWDSIGQPIFDMVRSYVETLVTVFSEKMPEIRDFVAQCFEDIQLFWEENLKPCLDAIKTFLTEVLAPIFETVFIDNIKVFVDNAFSFIVAFWNETLKPVLVGITDFLTGVFTGDWRMAFDGILGIVQGAMSGIKNAITTAVNTAKEAINGLIEKINSVKVPAWLDNAPIIGGLFEDGHVNIPTLATGGVLKKGEIGLLEGDGAEAVVPLDQNRAWISAVARDMDSSMGGKETVNMLGRILDAINRTNDGQDELKDSFASMKIEMNNREFGRLVKAVN
jgi:hypothetical protein